MEEVSLKNPTLNINDLIFNKCKVVLKTKFDIYLVVQVGYNLYQLISIDSKVSSTFNRLNDEIYSPDRAKDIIKTIASEEDGRLYVVNSLKEIF